MDTSGHAFGYSLKKMRSWETLRDHKGQVTEELRTTNIIMNNIIQKAQIKFYFTQFIRIEKKDIQNMRIRSVGNTGCITMITKKNLKMYFEQLSVTFYV